MECFHDMKSVIVGMKQGRKDLINLNMLYIPSFHQNIPLYMKREAVDGRYFLNLYD